MFIPNGVKEILLLQLEKYENKYVLSELLYYIVSENHMLPDIDAERLKQHQKQFSDKKDEFRLNICMNLREKMDEDRKNLVEKTGTCEGNSNGLHKWKQFIEKKRTKYNTIGGDY